MKEEEKRREGREGGEGRETQPNLSCGKSLLSSFSERFVVVLVLATLERRDTDRQIDKRQREGEGEEKKMK